MRLRLDRPEPYAYTDIGRCNDQWPDHRARVAVTAALLDWMKPNSVMDPACGGEAEPRCP